MLSPTAINPCRARSKRLISGNAGGKVPDTLYLEKIMMVRCAALGLLCSTVFLSSLSLAAEPKEVLLWPEGAPGAQGSEPIDQPSITIYQAAPEQANGTAILVCPGGAYRHLAMDHEGKQIAAWLNSIGVTAGILKYRLGPKYNYPSQLQDAQRGIRYLRANAEALKIDPQRVGIWGFSAGGHLASTASTHFDRGQPESADPLERLSCRPDFAILAYPVISLTEDFTHKGSRRNLLGENPDPELIKKLSSELQVTAETPPTFLFQTTNDASVPPQHAVLYYLALVKNKVPCEMHIFEQGKHGVGLGKNVPELTVWPDLLKAWLNLNGLLKKA